MKKNFGFLIYENAEELDIVGPWEIIKIWSEFYNGPENVFLVSEQGGLVKCMRGMRIHADVDFAHCPPLNYLLVVGGPGRKHEVNNEALINFISEQAKSCEYVMSVCTGSFLLQKAGLLQNHKATTYWLALEEFKKLSGVKVEEQRYVVDGNILTGAGISSGIDLALALINLVAGREIAGKVQLRAEYFPPREQYADLKDVPGLPEYLM